MTSQDWSDVENILCVRLDNVGDVLMTTPAIRALKHSGRRRRVTLLASPAGAKAGAMVPEIDRVIAYEAPWMKASAPRLSSASDVKIIEAIKSSKFDAAVIFTVFSQNPLPAALLCYLANVPRRTAHCRENPYYLLTDWIKEPEPETKIRHEVRRQLDLVGALGAKTPDERLSLRVDRAARARVERVLLDAGINLKRPVIVVHPGATAPSRCYPAEKYAEVVSELSSGHKLQVVLTGDASERDLAGAIGRAAGQNCWSLAGKLSLEELAAAISLASLLISNNTGPAHIAAAVGTPVVDLYALTNPQHTPWKVPHRLLFHDSPCRFCYKSVCPEGHHDCLRRVESARVVAATLDLLRETAGREATRCTP